MRIAHISDLHFGDADEAVLELALQTINASAIDVVAVSGDITQSGRRAEFAAAGAYFKRLTPPVVGTPGNHDAPVFSPLHRLMSPYARFAGLQLLRDWSAPGEELVVRSLNTARPIQARADWSQGSYRLAQLRAVLAVHTAHTGWRVIVAHHPPGTPLGAHVHSQARRWQAARAEIFATPRTLFLSGHTHRFSVERTPAPQSALLVAPTLASQRMRHGGHGFSVIETSAEKAVVTLWLRKSSAFEPAGEIAVD